MSHETIVAKRYAKALFEVAQGEGNVEQVGNDLKAVVDAIVAHPDLGKLLQHPNLDITVKTKMLADIFAGKVVDSVLRTFNVLIIRRRENLLAELYQEYTRIANELTGQTVAQVTSPKLLTKDESLEISQRFSVLIGKNIRIENHVDPSLIGGVQVRIGDRLYDGSLSGKLDRLQKSLHVS